MDKKKLIELIENNTKYLTQSENVKKQFPLIKEQIEFAIDQLINSVKEECAVIAEEGLWANYAETVPNFNHDVMKYMRTRIAKAIRDNKEK